MRYSASFITAIVISFFVFLGMSFLVTNKSTYQSSDFEIPNFSMVDDMETPTKVKRDPPKIPEQKEVKQPPAKPHLDITNDPTRPTVLPTSPSNSELEHFTLTGVNLPSLNPGNAVQLEFYRNSDVRCIACIQPNYPQGPARDGIEGWVKVEFMVNEFGTVTEVKVIDSKPKRTFDQATLKAIRKSKFKPLLIDGVPMAQTAIQIIEFKLDQ